MTTEYLIASDCNDLKRYFIKKFELLEISIIEENNCAQEVRDSNAILPDDAFSRLSHLVKPDMVINIYAYFEFWANRLCKKISKNKNESFIDALERCLQEKHKADISELKQYLNGLKVLNTVRNAYMHRGGHPNENEIEVLKGINLLGCDNMVIIDRGQIFEWLDNTKTLLVYIENQMRNSKK